MKVTNDILYGENEAAHRLNLYLPEGNASGVFVYFHGGGLDHGDKNHADAFAPYLTEHGIAVVSANYRMYPDAAYPDFLYDAASVVAWADKYMKDNLGCDKLYVSGSSAGGFLSMMLCFDKRYLASVGLDNSVITAYLHDAGQPTAHFTVLKYKGVDPKRIIIDETAPLYHIGTEEKYPPMRFIVSDDDMTNRYEQTMLVLSTMAHFGYEDFDHVVMHGKHCKYVGRIDEDGISAFAKLVLSFIDKWGK